MMLHFNAPIAIIGINPYVLLPGGVLAALIMQAQKEKSPIPVKGFINETPFLQNLVKFKGAWRLYINTTMLKNSPKRIGETIAVKIEFDPAVRTVAQHPQLVTALERNKKAKAVFDNLTPSVRLEMVRYISRLKTPESIDRNVAKAIAFLLEEGRFAGRDGPKNPNP